MPASSLHRLWIASDHAGFELKSRLLARHPELPWQDLGPASDARVDYPDFSKALCERLLADPASVVSYGILICGSGQGMCMSANRTRGIRAALCWAPNVAQLAREHNDANVLCLPARLISENTADEIVTTFLQTPFAGGRHQDRIDKF